MDEADYAAARQAELNEEALAAWRRTNATAQIHGRERISCEECGEEIPPARRAALPGCRRCVECQKEAEMRQPG